jgi:MoxR-like ATPase
VRPKSFIVLGVSHRVQVDDPNAPFKTFDDPVYKKIVREIVSNEHIDFVGEEAGNKTTHAEQIALELLGPGHYLNVNPSAEEEQTLGVVSPCHGSSLGEPHVMHWSVEKNERRETFWVDRIVKANATRAY